MRNAQRTAWGRCTLLLALALIGLATAPRAGWAETPKIKADHPLERPYELDFRFQPPDWVTAVGLPDDWRKPLTDRTGALLYDYPGRFAEPAGYPTGVSTRVRVDLADAADEEWQSQALEDPRIPIVTTKNKMGDLEVEAKAFAVTDNSFWPGGKAELPQPRLTHWGIEQLKGGNDWFAWAIPACAADAGFLDAQYTVGDPLQFRFKAEAGKSYQAVFGFCENFYDKAAMPMELWVEGQARAAVDLANASGAKSGKNEVFIQSVADKRDAGKNMPFVQAVSARDLDGDGWINLEVRPAASSATKRALLSVLWVFKDLPPENEIISGVATSKALGYFSLGEEAKLLKFGAAPLAPNKGRGIVHQADGQVYRDWAKPLRPADPGFINIEATAGKPLVFRYLTQPGKKCHVVFGLCEGWFDKPGARVERLAIEGQVRETVDLVKAAGGKNIPFLRSFEASDANGDGAIDIQITPDPSSTDQSAVLNVLWVFEGTLPANEEILSGKATSTAAAYYPCGQTAQPKASSPARPPRTDLILAAVRNNGPSPTTARPRVLIQAQQGAYYDNASHVATLVAGERVTASEAPEKVLLNENGDQLILTLPAVRLQPGQTHRFVTAIHSNAAPSVWSVDAAEKALKGARDFWKKFDLPYNVIRIPDPAMQGLLDSSIRNLRQAREVVDGKLRYQVGATIFRGIFVVDGSFMLDAEASLGRVKDARAGLETFLSFQKPDGAFEMMPRYWKENGVMLWMIDRHVQLTGDRAWLEKNWGAVTGAVKTIQRLRKEASKDPKALNAGLIPDGLSDGGFLNGVEYSNAYWTLIGLKSAVALAERMGKPEEAKAYRAEFEDMNAVFRKAAARDLYTDEFGNQMLPVPMARPLTDYPQMAQWAFCQAVYPGELFAPDDPLMVGTMNNLIDNEAEGLVRGTGWHKPGVWNYFGSFYAHDFLWLGDGQKAVRTAYAFANHASPMLVWIEEQSLQHHKTGYNGDMPHNWGSAEFIRLMLHLLVFERGDELHLLEGLPPTWLKPEAVTAVNKALTRFGEISLELRVSKDGRTATLNVTPPTRTPPSRIVVHLPGGQTADLAKQGKVVDGKVQMTWTLAGNK